MKGLVVKSTYNWYWFVDGLMEADYRGHLANPAAMQQDRRHRRQTAAAGPDLPPVGPLPRIHQNWPRAEWHKVKLQDFSYQEVTRFSR